MKKNMILLSLIAIPFITGCGGTTDSTIDPAASATVETATAETATISGTVPGTLIEAFCDDGTYVQVTSTQNGTNQHPFEISIPTNTNCRLVMTTNENDPANRVITPIGFINGTATGSTLTLNADVNLSHIPLELDYANANDIDMDHVVDQALLVDLNNTESVNLNDTPVLDTDADGIVDAYEDDDNDDIVNAYEDDDHDGIANIHDDDDNDHKPDYIEDDDNDGKINHSDDDNGDDTPDYMEDDDNDGLSNHIDDDDDNDGIRDDEDNKDDNDHTPAP